MSREITRIGVYWFPPKPLVDCVEGIWRKELSHKHKVCDLVARHCGECLLWRLHATVLDAICIIADDRDRFVQAMRDVAARHLRDPIELPEPDIKEWGWGNNVFLRWKDGDGRSKFKRFREEIAAQASKFMVIEKVSWEAINAIERLAAALNPHARWEFMEALRELKGLTASKAVPRLPYAPNVSLEWYIDRLVSGKDLQDATLPFDPSPHVSIASAVRGDEKYKMTAEAVGTFIKDELKNIPELKGLVGAGVTHTVERVHIVEPATAPIAPLEVIVVDRISGKARAELRQPWEPTEQLWGPDKGTGCG